MKAFVSYRHSGEDKYVLKLRMAAIKQGLERSGLEYYCTYFDEDGFQAKDMGASEIMHHAFDIIKDDCDFLLVVLANNEKSEGMLMEIGYCIAKGIPVVVVISTEVVNSYVHELANMVCWWGNLYDLEDALATLDVVNIVQ